MIQRLKSSIMALVIFLILAISLGSLYIRNNGPKSVGDYDLHILGTYMVATGQLSNDFEKDADNHGIKKMQIYGPANMLSLKDANFFYEGLVLNPFARSSEYYKQKESYNQISTKKAKALLRTQYPFINWLPQAIGLKIGMFLNASPWQSWQMARISNFSLFLILMSLAIIIAPFGKWVLTLIGSFPLSLYLASSLSGDAINIAISSIFVAYVLSIREKSMDKEKAISLIEIAILMFFTLLMFSLKVAYVPMLLFILVIPNVYFPFKKKILSIGSAGLIGVLGYLLWSRKYSTVLLNFDSLSANKEYLLHHIPDAIYSIFTQTLAVPLLFLKNMSSPNDGANLGFITILFVIFILVASIIINHQNFVFLNDDTLKTRFLVFYPVIIAFLAYFFTIALTQTALLTTWTQVYPGPGKYDITNIQGFQARYLLPVAPLLLVTYGTSKQYIR